MKNRYVTAVVCSPANGAYGVNIYRAGELGNEHMMMYVPCNSYDHAQQVAEAINNGDKS